MCHRTKFQSTSAVCGGYTHIAVGCVSTHHTRVFIRQKSLPKPFLSSGVEDCMRQSSRTRPLECWGEICIHNKILWKKKTTSCTKSYIKVASALPAIKEQNSKLCLDVLWQGGFLSSSQQYVVLERERDRDRDRESWEKLNPLQRGWGAEPRATCNDWICTKKGDGRGQPPPCGQCPAQAAEEFLAGLPQQAGPA